MIAGYPAGTRVWIGGNDLAKSGHWVWSRGQPISGFTNWASTASGDCMEIILPNTGWHATHCHQPDSAKHAFLAEKRKAI
jgi:hypothetical protein